MISMNKRIFDMEYKIYQKSVERFQKLIDREIKKQIARHSILAGHLPTVF